MNLTVNRNTPRKPFPAVVAACTLPPPFDQMTRDQIRDYWLAARAEQTTDNWRVLRALDTATLAADYGISVEQANRLHAALNR